MNSTCIEMLHQHACCEGGRANYEFIFSQDVVMIGELNYTDEERIFKVTRISGGFYLLIEVYRPLLLCIKLDPPSKKIELKKGHSIKFN